jgi:hypothetical protein
MESSFTAAKEFERDRRGDVSSSSSAQCGHTPCPPTLNSTLPLRAHFLKIETIVLWERWERKRVREPSNGRGNLLFLTPPCAYCSPSFVPDPCASFLLRFFFLGHRWTGAVAESGDTSHFLQGKGGWSLAIRRSSSSSHRFAFHPHSPSMAP